MLVRWLALASIVLLPASLPGAFGEASESEDESEPEAEEAAQTPAEAPEEIFLPTEEISEDYAAPFPVDI